MSGTKEWEAYITISNEKLSVIKNLLVEKKLNSDAVFRGKTLLTVAIYKNSPELLTLLLEHGANPNKKSNENDRNEPPIMTAMRLKHFHLVPILVKSGASLSIRNFYGEDVIYEAVKGNAFDILIYFLETKSHGSCFHGSVSRCPLQLAIQDGATYPSKRKSLLILLKYHYICSCTKSTRRLRISSSQFLAYSNPEIRQNLVHWIYLSYGINLIKPNGKQETGQLSLPDLTLQNIVRILIRKKVSRVAESRKYNFSQGISKLNLPHPLKNLLMMSELQI